MRPLNSFKKRVIGWLARSVRTIVLEELRNELELALDRDASDVHRQLKRVARDDSAEWLRANVPLPLLKSDRYELMKACAPSVPPEGLILEFGVWTGNSIRHLASLFPSRRIHGFDSFEGLDEPWITAPVGEFDLRGKLPEVPANVTLVKGWFDDTLPGFLAEQPGKVALLHVDSDLYSSCKTIFSLLRDRIVPGTVIVFDELYNFPGWRDCEYKAFLEWQSETGAEVEYLGYTASPGQDWSGHQVAMRVTFLGANGVVAREECRIPAPSIPDGART